MIETTVDGRYQILARIAAGGMGEVYRAHDSVLDRQVALKMLHSSLADDRGFIDRFRREARSAAMLSHPNIVAVHDWGETQGTYFMVMEFVRGPNLRAILMRDGSLQPAQAGEVVAKVLAALEHAHAQGIVHRDIKPENILIRSSDGEPKVGDFGLARAFADSRISHAPGTVTGTVQYLAPEQIEGQPADPRTDLYATGIVLYELLTGRVPFTGETSVAVAYKHLRERVPPPSHANPMVPVALDRVVLNATERNRDRRTADARTMRTDLAGAADELPPAAPLSELAASVAPADETPADRLATVTIPRAISPKQRRRQRVGRAFRWLGILAVVAALGWAAWEFVVPHPTRAPDVLGDTFRTAQAEADEAGLELVQAGEEYSSTVLANRIVSQSLDPGSEAEEGDRLSVILSLGPEFAPVPNVTGDERDAAEAALAEAGFEVRAERLYHDTVPAGLVIEQSPEAGTRHEVGRPVRITISRGRTPVAVPEVVGLAESEATAILQAANLEVRVLEEFSTSVERDRVISQQPPAQEQVREGGTVTIVVSKGPRRFPMPNVVGAQTGAAQAQLEGLGLQVRVVTVPNSSGQQVVSQDPDAGSTVEQGQQVTIYVA
jgi:beta-lactam-binding protein with PASTA domain/tRNA A-37 threonylcarbamoyl transferase component Bud32